MGRDAEPRKTKEHVYTVKNFHYLTNPWDKREKTQPEILGVAFDQKTGEAFAKMRAEEEVNYLHGTVGYPNGGFHVEEMTAHGVKMFNVVGARTLERHQAFYAEPTRVIR
jgi:hypothetical protein